MKLIDLVKLINKKDKTGVPDWMIGLYKRNIISFYNGKSDNTTDVFWMQSRTFTIDLRLPKSRIDKKNLDNYSKDELKEIGNYEGFLADSIYNGEELSWEGGISYHNRNKYPEPALLKKVGNCLLEFCPSNAYVEDWRLQNSSDNYLVGLDLIEEVNVSKNEIIRNSGGLIIAGEYAALCLGRKKEIDDKFNSMDSSLEDILLDEDTNILFKEELLSFETSLAKGTLEDGYNVLFSTNPKRYDENLFILDGFELSEDEKYIIHKFTKNDEKIKRVYKIDLIDTSFKFAFTSETSDEAKKWFKKEEVTLGRYLEKLK